MTTNDARMEIGEQVIELVSVESTNKTAAELIALSKAPHGTVILAQEQTAGRGQRGRNWHSTPGLDLTLSIVLEPSSLGAEDQFSLSKLAALAVYDVVHSIIPQRTMIKWPNDILVDRRKVAGILIECDLAGERVRHAIVGVGININSTHLPEELAATSLYVGSGYEQDRKTVLESLLAAFRERYAQWGSARLALDQDYAAALWARGRWAEMMLNGLPVTVRPLDVDRLGRLLVEHEEGQVAAYDLDRLRFSAR